MFPYWLWANEVDEEDSETIENTAKIVYSMFSHLIIPHTNLVGEKYGFFFLKGG